MFMARYSCVALIYLSFGDLWVNYHKEQNLSFVQRNGTHFMVLRSSPSVRIEFAVGEDGFAGEDEDGFDGGKCCVRVLEFCKWKPPPLTPASAAPPLTATSAAAERWLLIAEKLLADRDPPRR
ncbi:Mannan endo-1,4-beta-mannosidase 2 [Camellia lanceoleosa]|uniref:Mannan endo-1,4-beta-mannosidase 2 n=1 Tax=Camellia lanceoleosa TaxID=1840588 RepID=A0ACC0IAA8_9ERIC|nr:Mannan endo-1,4-beta-mannosidase 2 [Camellia lanceoleosa]